MSSNEDLERGRRTVDELAGELHMTRDELITVMRRALLNDPISPAPRFIAMDLATPEVPELHVRIVGAPIATNTAYAPVAFKSKQLGRWVARIRLTADGERWRDDVARQMLAARQRLREWRTDAPRYAVRIVYYFASHSSDIDGPIKLTLDALKPSIFEDDRQVGQLNVTKFVDRARPRIEIAVRALVEAPPRQEGLFGARGREDRSAGRG